MLFRRDSLCLQAGNHLGDSAPAGVDLDSDGRLAVVPPEQLLGLLRGQTAAEGLHQPLGVAVEQGEVGLRAFGVDGGQLVQVPGDVSQDAVDHPGGPGVFAVLFRQLHRLAHCCVGGNLSEEKHLVQAQAQVGQDLALHFGQLHGGEVLEVKVQQQLVLQNTKAETGGQRGVPPVQALVPEHFFQVSVGPCLLPLHSG